MLQKTKSLLTKCLAFLFIVCCVVAATVGMVACSDDQVAAKTIKSIANDGKKIVITYSDGTKDTVDYNDTTSSDPTPVEPTVCDHSKESESVSTSGCTEIHYISCDACGRFRVEVKENHVWGVEQHLERESCLKGARTTQVCVNCLAENDKVTVYDEGEVGKCYAKHLDIEKITYLCDPDKLGDSNPNPCTADVVTVDYCKTCGVSLEETKVTVKAKGHTATEWTVSVKPTASTTGLLVNKCGRDGCDEYALESITLPTFYSLDSNNNRVRNTEYTFVKAELATCVYTADTSKYSDYFVYKDPNGVEHTFEDKDSYAGENKHTLNGITIDGSSVIYVDDYAGLIKVFGTISCDVSKKSDGYFTCEACGEDVLLSARLLKKHTKPEVGVMHEDPTCQDNGSDTYTCAICGNLANDLIDTVAHNYQYTIVKNADGTYTFNGDCEWCGATKTVSSVSDVKEERTKEPSCSEAGEITYTGVKGKDTVVVKQSIAKIKHASETLGEVETGTALDMMVAANKAAIKVFTVTDKENNCKSYTLEGEKGMGYYVCKHCGESVLVRVYYSHTPVDVEKPNDKVDSAATCSSEGSKWIRCSVCCPNDWTVITVPALGHKYEYTYAADKLTATCSNEDCSKKSKITLTAESNYKVTRQPKCNELGRATYVENGETKTVDLAKIGHKLNGVEVVADENGKFSWVSGMKNFAGATPNCKSGISVYFNCDTCKEDVLINDVYGSHTKPTDSSTITVVPASCELKGYEKYRCSECETDVLVELSALKHNIVVDRIYDENGKLMIGVKCSRPGCLGFDQPSEYSEGLNVSKLAEDGKTYQKGTESKAIEIGFLTDTDLFTCETTVTATCQVRGVKVYTLNSDYTNVVFDEAIHIVYTKIGDYANHNVLWDNETNKPAKGEYTVVIKTVVDGEVVKTTLKGYYCESCGNVVSKNAGINKVSPSNETEAE